MPASVHHILQQTFGYPEFRPGQEAIIQSVLDGNDTLALLPTGGGKSVCFQVPALAMEGICLVITPLIALMKDQVNQLHRRNVPALAIHSGMTFFEVRKALQNACSGEFKFLYLSPERLQTQVFQEYLPAMPVNLVAVDEAHCISQWGYDFRPAYLQIAQLKEQLSHVPMLALTASATPRVQLDIIERLQFSMARQVFRLPFERPQLSLSAFEELHKMTRLLRILQQVPGSALVYCRSRKRTVEVAEQLKMHGLSAGFYHAGLPAAERSRLQDAWLKGELRIMACTNAFGMGIDKADVRAVVHYDLPDSLEAYYQEAGRAGRDGKRAYAVLLYTPTEVDQLRQLPDQKFIPLEAIKEVYTEIGNYLQLPAGSGEGQYYAFDLGRFCEAFKREAPEVLHALGALQSAGYLQFAEQVFLPATLQFIARRSYIEQVEQDHPALEPLMKLLLRTYEGILDYPVSIREKQLARHLQLPEGEVVKQLKQLVVYQVVDYQPMKEEPQLYYLYNRVEKAQLVLDEKLYRQRKANYTLQTDAMAGYATNPSRHCRSQMIRHYFGDQQGTDCGICDNCLQRKREAPSAAVATEVEAFLLQLLQQPQSLMHIRRSCLEFPASAFEAAFQLLLAEEKLVQLPDGRYTQSQPHTKK